MSEKTITRFEEGFLSLLLVGMTLLVFLEVVLRYGFNTGLHWTQEVTLHMAAWFVLFGASYGIKVGAHIGVDAVVKLLPIQTRRVVSLFAVFLCLVYCGLFLYGSWIYLAKIYSIGIGLDDARFPVWFIGLFSEETLWNVWRIDTEDPLVPMWLAHSILFIGFILLAYRFLQVGWNIVIGKTDSFALADEAEEVLEEIQSTPTEEEQSK
ncbi:MAG: TRAP transporter small permease [Alphaproteobacteria bacterium]|nr:TRAP transporter small permease [Rhodospirillales bacterium]MCW9045993.1 TRAP transporter small permease [Alphaproteobacteria bacterium]